MRGYRPSYFHVRSEDVVDERIRAKQENVQRYTVRVERGVPLFDVGSQQQGPSPDSPFAGR